MRGVECADAGSAGVESAGVERKRRLVSLPASVLKLGAYNARDRSTREHSNETGVTLHYGQLPTLQDSQAVSGAAEDRLPNGGCQITSRTERVCQDRLSQRAYLEDWRSILEGFQRQRV